MHSLGDHPAPHLVRSHGNASAERGLPARRSTDDVPLLKHPGGEGDGPRSVPAGLPPQTWSEPVKLLKTLTIAAGVAGIFIPVLWFGMDFQGTADKETQALQRITSHQ